MDKAIQAFKRKEVMNIEEMKNNVGNLNEITANLESAVTELEVRDVSDTTIAYLVILPLSHKI